MTRSNSTRPVEIWMLRSEQPAPSYYALVVYRDMGGPRQYAPEEKRKLGLRAQGVGWFTFHPNGLLCEGSSIDDLVAYIRSHTEIIATRKQLDDHYASKRCDNANV